MTDFFRRWKHILQYAHCLSSLNYIVNAGGRITVYAKGFAVTLDDSEDDDAFRVTIAQEEQTPYSSTLHGTWGNAVRDWTQSANDIDKAHRFLGDGDETLKEYA